MNMAIQPTLIISIITDREVTVPMYNPPHPGLTVRHDCLEPLGLTVTEGAKVLGVTRQALNNLVNGKAGISPEMAIRLSKAFGASPETWLRLQMAYDLAQARQKKINVKRVPRRALTDDLHP
jgi:addiction module HigA family antidote